jgi:hypothetical protein
MTTRSKHLANIKFPKKGSGQRTSYGLSPRNFPDSVKEFVDQDYINKLSREDQLWLATFNNNYYGADFRSSKDGLENPPEWSAEDRRRIYNAKNAANQDYYHIISARGDTIYIDVPPKLGNFASSITGRKHLDGNDPLVEFEIPAPAQDFSPAPVYLNSEEYKEKLATFRNNLNPSRCALPPKKLAPRYLKATAELRQVVASGLPTPEQDNVPAQGEVDRCFPKPKRTYQSKKD